MSDLIDRQQAIDAIADHIRFDAMIESNDASKDIDDYRPIAKNFLRYVPSAEPVRMKGRWIYGESGEGHDGYFCSQCGNFVPWIYKEFDIDFIKEFKFCPNCGASMSEGEEEC